MLFAMDDATYTLQELSELSGVEPRTIRSYIERDLLPGPRGLGPKAAYGPEHALRLEVIRLLRDARREITLDQIRSFLAQLTLERIAAIAAGGLAAGGEEAASFAPPSSSALQYLNSITTPRSASAPLARAKPVSPAAGRPMSPPPPPPAARAATIGSPASHGRTPFEELLGVLGAALGSGSVARSVRSETWHRVPITPDIELSVRGELDADNLALLQRIGDHLRHLLLKGTRP